MKAAILFLILATGVSGIAAQTNFLITSRSVGGVKLGMTISQARKVLSGCSFKRSSDGDGAVLISAVCGGKELMTFASQEDEETTINERAKIAFIEVWDSRFKTPDGIHKNMLVSEVEKSLGRVTKIILSEIESREFITFKKKRPGIMYRMYGGIYPPGKNTTARYERGTRLWSISVSSY
ncbi:MAG: hypothetical protein ABL999_13665 [Pyrinomonadaceae bacterium]